MKTSSKYFGRTILVAAMLATGIMYSRAVVAGTVDVDPGHMRLADVIAAAQPGDTLNLQDGIHAGPVVITKPLNIVGNAGAVIKGNDTGSVITVKAPDVTINGITVTGSGLLLETQDSGIFLSKEATNAKVLDNHLRDNLIGVYVWGAGNSLVKHNTILGRRDLRMNERGNGVQIWNAPGARVEANDIRYGRDGIFVTTSKNNVFADNLLHDLRFGVHYMYTNNSVVRGNISRRNHLGYAIMFSKKIKITKNVSENDRDRGILFNYANSIAVHGNRVTGGPEKMCVHLQFQQEHIFREPIFAMQHRHPLYRRV